MKNEKMRRYGLKIWIKKDVRKRKNIKIKMVLIEEEMRVLKF
jgi:hypothetical protein